ncbi:MAG TPA: BON domain-containing protein [Rhabdochlamydiaceae bacterium]
MTKTLSEAPPPSIFVIYLSRVKKGLFAKGILINLGDIVKKNLLIPVVCVMFASCSSNTNSTDQSNENNRTESNSSQPADWEITANVKKNLMADSSLSDSARMISVTTNNGVVTLTGNAASNEEIRKVVRTVQDTRGVVSVDNQLNVQTQSNSSQPADWEITASVKKNLMADSSLSKNARMISVTTNDGVVTLTGTAASNEEIRKVVRIVQNTRGVVSVDNQLNVSNS